MAGTWKTTAKFVRAMTATGVAAASLLLTAHLQAENPPSQPPAKSGTPAIMAQPQLPSPHAAKSPPKLINRPLWSELSLEQRQALAPLANEWNMLDAIRKKKWLEIASKYPKMHPDEQSRMQTRMRDWATLSPEQRRIARESYARAKKLDSEQKSAKWQQYQNLSEDEKKKLAADAEKKKNVANLPRSLAHRNPPARAVSPAPAAVLPSPATDSAGNAVNPLPATSGAAQPEPAMGPPPYIIK